MDAPLSYEQMMEQYGFIPFDHKRPNFFPVEKGPVYDSRGKVIPGHQAIFRGDTGDNLAIHSDKYALVPFEENFATIEAAIEKSGLKHETMRIGTDFEANGGKIYRQYLFPEHTMMVESKGVTRPLALRMYMFDSYDGSTKCQGRSGFFDFVCANSSIFGTEAASFSFRHVGNMEERIGNAVENLVRSTEQFLKNMPRLQQWPRIPLSAIQFGEIVEDMPQGGQRLTDELVARFAREQGESLWDGHQVLTAWSTHGIPPRTQADRQKRVAALVEGKAWQRYDLEVF